MYCKCKNHMTVMEIQLDVHISKSVMFYCYTCGRIYVVLRGNRGKWIESQKSKNNTFVNKDNIDWILERMVLKDNISLKNKIRNSTIKEIKEKIDKLPKF